MRHAVLAHETDVDGWRDAARALLAEAVPPHEVHWRVEGDAPDLIAQAAEIVDDRSRAEDVAGPGANTSPARTASSAPPAGRTLAAPRVPRAFIDLCRSVVMHREPERFALLYRLVWRLQTQPDLLALAVDPDVARAQAMRKAVDHAIHRMHAFVRFRAIDTDAAPPPAADPDAHRWYVAWFEPPHRVLEAAAPFFTRRFANMRWSILTPERCAHWDRETLRFTPGVTRDQAPDDDVLEDLWRTYYASIFNPTRLNPDLMRQHMPRAYWRNLPEAAGIAPLVAQARARTRDMLASAPTEPGRHAEAAHAMGTSVARRSGMPIVTAPDTLAPATLDEVRRAARGCRACPLWEPATQTVFGEGTARSRVMFVGEQPGDQEDLAGAPFVGPAGKLFDRALAQAGVDRGSTYVTNAVKHFKFVIRGERRLHQKPKITEIRACHPWLEHELALVQPELVVALGATAAQSLLGRETPIEKNRGRWMAHARDARLLVTVHPSYLLRLPDADAKAREYERFVDDLRRVAQALG